MEIVFQNKCNDFDAYHDYMLNETQQGKRLGNEAYRTRHTWMLLFVALIIVFFWAASGDWKYALLLSPLFFLGAEGFLLIPAKFNPRYYYGKEIYKRREEFIVPDDLEVFLLPKTITFNNDWLEIYNSGASHHYRWRRVVHIGQTQDFIFIHVGNCPVTYIPKRDFPSEQSFNEFGK